MFLFCCEQRNTISFIKRSYPHIRMPDMSNNLVRYAQPEEARTPKQMTGTPDKKAIRGMLTA